MDRLSELPESMIFEIFRWLPMRKVVQTTILSKRWKTLWTTTPYLDFKDDDSEFINRALMRWRGLRILRFGLNLHFGNTVYSSDVDLWLRLAMEKGVEELDLDGHHLGVLYRVVHDLYACSSLKVLSLTSCDLGIPHGIVHWNQLRSLTIGINDGSDEHLINQVVCGSPQLEELTLILDEADSCKKLSVRSSSLKKLLVHKFCRNCTCVASTELSIWTPNLETLDVKGAPCVHVLLMNNVASSLTHLTLDLIDYNWGGEDAFLQDILGHNIALTLAIYHDEVLGTMNDKCLCNSNFLTINAKVECYGMIMDLLRISPKLETFVVKHDYDEDSVYYYSQPKTWSIAQYERNLPESFLVHLRRVEIDWVKKDVLIYPFVVFLLKHASNLQKTVFRTTGIKARWTKKMLRMPRSSPTAEFIFVEYPSY